MSQRSLTALVTASMLFAAVFIVTLAGCGGEMTDEEAVKAVVEDMAEAAEAKDAGRIKDHISRDYSDPGGMGYQEMKAFLALQMMQSEHISVFLRKVDVEVKGDKAYANVRALIGRGEKPAANEEDPGTDRSGFVFDLTFVKQDGDWLMTEAIYRQVPVMEAL